MKLPAVGVAATANLRRRGFTLIELMMVVLIMGIVMAAGIPSLMSSARKEGMRKAVSDVVMACEKARANAIISGTTTEVHFRPQDGTVSVKGGSGFSEKLPENIAFEMLDINLAEYYAAEDAAVRFFPDGRCDEMVAVLLSDKGERRAISLEITTSLATVYDDPRKLLSR